jgi:hypothetical protein
MNPVAWRKLHWWIGLLTLAAFLSAGLFMRYVAHVPDLPVAERLVYRSRFLLLLMAGLANLGLSKGGPESTLERIASAIVMIAPIFLVTAFLRDPAFGVHGSQLTGWTMRSLFAAAVLLAIARRPRI